MPSGFALRWQSGEADPAILTDAERRRAAGMGHAGRRRHFLLGRTAARTLLAEFLDTEPQAVSLRATPDGALDVAGSSLCVSIAHSGKYAVAVAGPRALGVDLERIQPRSPGLVRRIAREEERSMLAALPLDEARIAILAWTLKEAALKAAGTGLRRALRDLVLDLDVPRQRGRCIFPDRAPMDLCFAERNGYMVSLAVENARTVSSPHP